ncbi:hypothetical protein JCM15765_02000 [Paradesulfitobacterium aromaticivorans]
MPRFTGKPAESFDFKEIICYLVLGMIRLFSKNIPRGVEK